MKAMSILKRKKLPFGISACYTSANVQDVGSEAYFDQMIEWGAKSTDYQARESAEEYSNKCAHKSAKWAETADRLWQCSGHCTSCNEHIS